MNIKYALTKWNTHKLKQITSVQSMIGCKVLNQTKKNKSTRITKSKTIYKTLKKDQLCLKNIEKNHPVHKLLAMIGF